VEIPESPAAEAFRNLRAALSLLGPEVERKFHSLPAPCPMKEKFNLNYSLALAQQGYASFLSTATWRAKHA